MKIRYVFAAFLCVAVLLACSCNTSDSGESVPTYDSETGAINFDGRVFQIATHRRTDCQLIPETGSSTRGDLLLAHYDKIEKDYNCDIDIFAAEDPVNRILLSVSSDFKYADICEEWLTTLYKLIKAEMLVPLSYFDCFDDELFSGKYGLTNFIEATKIKGEYYGFYPGYWGLPTQQFAAVLYFNQDYINQAGVENPQEHYEKDDWT